MRAFALAALGAAFLCSCVPNRTNVVTVNADAETAASARRLAVAGLFDLYASSETLRANAPLLDEKILARASDFVSREKLVKVKDQPGLQRLRGSVQLDKLGKALDDLGLVKPAGVEGRPVLLVRILESGPGAGSHAASEAVRRALFDVGYDVADLSALSKEASNEEAKKLKTGALVMGTAAAKPLDEPRVEGLSAASALVSLKAVAASGPQTLDEVEASAESFDSGLAGAGQKALSAAGEIAAAKLRRVLSARWRERTEMSALFLGLGGVEQARKLIYELRAQPGVHAAALDTIIDDDVKVRIFVENPSADELASALMKLPGHAFNIRDVESDYRSVEMDASGRSWHAF